MVRRERQARHYNGGRESEFGSGKEEGGATPAPVLLFLMVAGDPESGGFYVFDRKQGPSTCSTSSTSNHRRPNTGVCAAASGL